MATSDNIVIEVCSFGFDWEVVIIDLDDGMVPNGRQAII